MEKNKGIEPSLYEGWLINDAEFKSLLWEGTQAWTPDTVDEGCVNALRSYEIRLSQLVSYLENEGDIAFPLLARVALDALTESDRNDMLTVNPRREALVKIKGIIQYRIDRFTSEEANLRQPDYYSETKSELRQLLELCERGIS